MTEKRENSLTAYSKVIDKHRDNRSKFLDLYLEHSEELTLPESANRLYELVCAYSNIISYPCEIMRADDAIAELRRLKAEIVGIVD